VWLPSQYEQIGNRVVHRFPKARLLLQACFTDAARFSLMVLARNALTVDASAVIAADIVGKTLGPQILEELLTGGTSFDFIAANADRDDG
jgi:hypothetical protein